jgi:hypothetical protein
MLNHRPTHITDITHAELKTLKDSSLLVEGLYRITDFRTVYDLPDYDGMGGINYSTNTFTADTIYMGTTINSGGFIVGDSVVGLSSGQNGTVVGLQGGDSGKPIIMFVSGQFTLGESLTGSLSGTSALLMTAVYAGNEPLTVRAVSNNKISSEAFSDLFPNDRIQYDIDFVLTEIMGYPAKGRITERIDDHNNRTDYDHRNIAFIRYDIDGYGNFTSYKNTGNPSRYFLTFAGVANDVKVGDYAKNILQFSSPGSVYILANNVFSNFCVFTRFGDFVFNNTFGQMESCTFNSECIQNIIGNLSLSHIDSGFYNNVIGDLQIAQIAGSFQYNIIGTNCSNLSFKSNCSSLTIYDSSSDCEFGNGNGNVVFTAPLNKAKFGDGTLNGQDFSAATHVYNNYYTEAQVMTDSSVGLVFMDPSNGLGTSPVAVNA